MPLLLDAESTVQPGHVLGGRYRVESVLGMGGMGVVVAARHVTLKTRFAVKLMRREAAKDAEAVERFLREARAAGQLKSQHSVRVLDVGKLDDGAPFMVMEFLVGMDLGELLREKGARSPAEAVDYVLQACEGIAEAHALGIVHRDLKPQNLFLTRGVDGMPLVKVLDFGLAKSMKSTAEIRALTQSAAVMGSPAYMSPEQMRASRDVDVRSDMWSLGVCLYELLTARAPFTGATYAELCSMVLNAPPEPMPSDIPRGLARVVARCLQKEPRRRPDDVGVLAEALEPFASTPGAARRIRAVLDAPRLELESVPSQAVHDPAADTKTAASLDTTTRRDRERGAPLGVVGRAGIASVIGGVVLGLAIVMRSAGPSPSSPPSNAETPVSAAEVVTPPAPAATPAPDAIPVMVPEDLPLVPSVPSGANAPSSPREPSADAPFEPPAEMARSAEPAKPSTARGAAARRAPRTAPPPAPTAAAPKASPVLVPKTTEF